MQTDDARAYKRDWIRRKRADVGFRQKEQARDVVRRRAARDAERERRRIESAAIKELAMRLDVDSWPLLQGYKAGERGQKCDPQQTLEWKRGWQLWNSRHGRR